MKLVISAMLIAAVACAPRSAAPDPTSTSTASVAAATTTPATTSVPSAGTPQPAATGAITGLVAYPAEGHPAVTICAFGATDRSVHFCVDVPRATTPPKSPYAITVVRSGTYQLFAYAEGSDKAGGAYTEFVKCGLSASCSDHTPIDVTVRAGETVRDIEVSDWYAPSDSWPTRPR
jgi:hypothetical protein